MHASPVSEKRAKKLKDPLVPIPLEDPHFSILSCQEEAMTKRLLVPLVAFIVATIPVAHSDTAFPYTSLGISVGELRFDDDIVLSPEDTYSSITLVGFQGTYQINGGPYVQVSASAGEEDTRNTDLEITSFSLGGGFPVQLHQRADLVFQAEFIQEETEFCVDQQIGGQYCYDEDDSGLGYGISARIWAVPGNLGQFELNPFISDSTLDDTETTYGARARAWFTANHTASLSFSTADESETVALSYVYFWQ